MLARVERAAAVAEAEIEARVRAENQLAAVVVLLGLVDAQQLADELAVAELADARVAALVAPVHEQTLVGGEIRVERHAEEALLGADEDTVREVELRAAALATDADQPARLLEYPERVGVAGRAAHPGRTVEAGRDALEVEVVRAARLGGREAWLEAVAGVAVSADRHGGEPEQHGNGRDGEDEPSHRREHIRRT